MSQAEKLIEARVREMINEGIEDRLRGTSREINRIARGMGGKLISYNTPEVPSLLFEFVGSSERFTTYLAYHKIDWKLSKNSGFHTVYVFGYVD